MLFSWFSCSEYFAFLGKCALGY